MAGRYRGVPNNKRERLERVASEMRRRNLTTGIGCRAIARAIEQRTGKAAV